MFFYKEAKKEEREDYQRRISQIDASTIVYIDESGVDNRFYRTHARAPRGVKIYASISKKIPKNLHDRGFEEEKIPSTDDL